MFPSPSGSEGEGLLVLRLCGLPVDALDERRQVDEGPAAGERATMPEHHLCPGQPIEVPSAAPSQARFEDLVPLVNMLLGHRSGDAACDLVSMAAALASWRGTTDETAPVRIARAMVRAARRLDPDAERAALKLQ